jgi:hypothetical protein
VPMTAAARQPLGSQIAGVLVINAEPFRSDVDERRRRSNATRAALRDPRGGYPVDMPAWPAEVSRGRRERQLRHQQAVADHGDGRGDLDAGDLGDLVVLGHGDAAVDARQEVGPDQDEVGGHEVRRDRARCAQLGGPAAAVSTVKAVVASSIPASSATSRVVRNLSCDQASRLIARHQPSCPTRRMTSSTG